MLSYFELLHFAICIQYFPVTLGNRDFGHYHNMQIKNTETQIVIHSPTLLSIRSVGLFVCCYVSICY